MFASFVGYVQKFIDNNLANNVRKQLTSIWAEMMRERCARAHDIFRKGRQRKCNWERLNIFCNISFRSGQFGSAHGSRLEISTFPNMLHYRYTKSIVYDDDRYIYIHKSLFLFPKSKLSFCKHTHHASACWCLAFFFFLSLSPSICFDTLICSDWWEARCVCSHEIFEWIFSGTFWDIEPLEIVLYDRRKNEREERKKNHRCHQTYNTAYAHAIDRLFTVESKTNANTNAKYKNKTKQNEKKTHEIWIWNRRKNTNRYMIIAVSSSLCSCN